MRYLCLIYGDENAPEIPGRSDWESLMRDHTAFSEEAGAAGVLHGGEALELTPTATTIREKGDDQVITDGPFAETKEQLGGYYLIDVDTPEEAAEWAAKIPAARYGTIEVRALMQIPAEARA